MRQQSSASTAQAPASSWYAQSRLLDATGDGQPDTVWLRANGHRGDSLDIALTVVAAGREVLRESWQSDYMLVDPPFDRPAARAVVDSFVRARLDSTLARVSLEPVANLQFRAQWPPVKVGCEEDARDCIAGVLRDEGTTVDWGSLSSDSAIALRKRIDNAPFDTAAVIAIAEDIRRNTRNYVLFGYGYETSVAYAWSPRAQRFFMVFFCC